MYHGSTSIIAALGLSAVLLSASPASAGTAHRIEEPGPLTDQSATSIVSARMAERGYSVRETGPLTDQSETPIVSPRMAERG